MDESEHAINFELHIRPETRSQSWCATLERQTASGKTERLEFRSPLELARHLASLENPKPNGKLR